MNEFFLCELCQKRVSQQFQAHPARIHKLDHEFEYHLEDLESENRVLTKRLKKAEDQIQDLQIEVEFCRQELREANQYIDDLENKWFNQPWWKDRAKNTD